MDSLFEINMALRCKIRDLENKIEEFKSGARYLKLQKDHHRVVAGYIKEINNLRKELADTRAQVVNVRNIWTEECYDVFDEYRAEMKKRKKPSGLSKIKYGRAKERAMRSFQQSLRNMRKKSRKRTA